MPLPRVSPATPGLLGTWRQPQLEPCPEASPLLDKAGYTTVVAGVQRAVTWGRGRGCSPGVAGTQLQPGGQSVPRCAGGCKRRWFLSAAGLREGTPSSRPARWLQHAIW